MLFAQMQDQTAHQTLSNSYQSFHDVSCIFADRFQPQVFAVFYVVIPTISDHSSNVSPRNSVRWDSPGHGLVGMKGSAWYLCITKEQRIKGYTVEWCLLVNSWNHWEYRGFSCLEKEWSLSWDAPHHYKKQTDHPRVQKTWPRDLPHESWTPLNLPGMSMCCRFKHIIFLLLAIWHENGNQFVSLTKVCCFLLLMAAVMSCGWSWCAA